ncbi:uncharacterized protein K452DRAFT_282029 [Aplosporella prunicola CBS 121167]|uniref:Metallo-beta-lactamase domain-containing protein n=1 Tax=Aplosporella prunicola CBS 121167 TaxID=1176127 RepID=A0A6A6BUU2_9PEZI|nr:uncharacterized protein K452DRAFT_282029 [Aplosporella prunicola CBS 121167]KAF2147045.1 hypothetical protein K452DRAFT_282029 [Aplosporella prunicola CBS 121167]
MAPPSFKSSVSITHIGTATAILSIDGINILTDPFFGREGATWGHGANTLHDAEKPALSLASLPPIDAVLLSHEDHPDNLDEVGRQLLDARTVLTTRAGAKNLAPRPGVQGLAAWEAVTLNLGGKAFKVTATPCTHVPGGEVVGFVLESASFGTSPEGLPNALWFSGDTVYIEELKELRTKWHVVAAILNLGCAHAVLEDGTSLQITMGGKEGAKLVREIGADLLVPMHYESWGHFTQFGKDLVRVFEEEGVADRVCWLEYGKPKNVF